MTKRTVRGGGRSSHA